MPNYRSTVTPVTPMPSLPSLPRVTQPDAVEQILGAINAANAHTTTPQRDAHVEAILKQMNQHRFKAVEHLVAVGFNLIDRRAPLEDVEEPGQRYIALMRGYHAARWGRGASTCTPTLASLWLTERLAHSERETKLALFLDDRSYYHATQLLAAAANYERENSQFIDFVRQKAVEANGARLAVARAQ